MQIKTFLLAVLFGTGLLATQAQTLSIGNYDDYEEYDFTLPNAYEGSSWEISPINFYYTNSGTQILLTKDELASLAGKNITSLAFKYYSEGAYINPTVGVKVWLSETDDTEFYYDATEKRYKYFAVDTDSPVYTGNVEADGFSYDYCVGEPLLLTFTTPYYYKGDKNLVVTITAEGSTETAEGAFYINFSQSDLINRALTFADDNNTLSSVLDGDLWAHKTTGSTVNAPDMQFGYEDAPEPIEETIDVAVTNITAPASVDLKEGSQFDVTVTLTNNGNTTAENVNVKLLANDEVVQNSNAIADYAALTIEPGEEKTVVFTYEAQTLGDVTLTAEAEAADDIDLENNKSTAVTVNIVNTYNVDLIITQVKVPETVDFEDNDQILVKVFVTNQGDDTANDVVVRLFADGNLLYSSADIEEYAGLTVAPGEVKIISFVYDNLQEGNVVFTAEVEANGEVNTSNNDSEPATLQVVQPDYGLAVGYNYDVVDAAKKEQPVDQPLTVGVHVVNNGSKAVNAYTIVLKANGETVETRNNTIGVLPGTAYDENFTYTATQAGAVTFTAEVSYDKDTYDNAPEDNVAEITVNFAQPTAINGIAAGTRAAAPAYNLAGQRVTDSYKGIVIINGKKITK